MKAWPKVYLAGPDVFNEHAWEDLLKKKEALAHYRLEALLPLDNQMEACLLEDLSLSTPNKFSGEHFSLPGAQTDISFEQCWNACVNKQQQTSPALAYAIYQANIQKMEEAQAMLANVDPFRGPHMDPGTAFEIGFFVAKAKPVVCYTHRPSTVLERVRQWSGEVRGAAPEMRDRDNRLIEDFNLQENLMIEGSLWKQHQKYPLPSVVCHSFEEAVKNLASFFYGL